jgi:hypothetical protein
MAIGDPPSSRVMWTSLLLIDDQIQASDELVPYQLIVVPEVLLPPRSLLIQLQTTEDAHHAVAYTALLCMAARLDPLAQTGQLALTAPVDVLTPSEQQTLRAWMMGQSWPAWARAALAVRAAVGVSEAPVLLAEAARAFGMPLITLAKAAERGRLPTIRAGDRHLIYLTTISEALRRGRLHLVAGRPRHRS